MRKAIAEALHGLTITPDKVPGILIEATWDDTGEIDRISFLAEVKDGKQVITETLPKLEEVERRTLASRRRDALAARRRTVRRDTPLDLRPRDRRGLRSRP